MPPEAGKGRLDPAPLVIGSVEPPPAVLDGTFPGGLSSSNEAAGWPVALFGELTGGWLELVGSTLAVAESESRESATIDRAIQPIPPAKKRAAKPSAIQSIVRSLGR